MVDHANSYIICATPRSGSTLLCDLLGDTRLAGRPDSFFRRQSIPWWVSYFGVSMEEWNDDQTFDLSYLAAVQQQGSNGTGCFGMRLMWESVGDLTTRLETLYPGLPNDSARFRSAFGPSIYVHLSRKDKVAQAVSRLRAEQTGLWHVAADGSERERLKLGHAPVYDAQALSELVTEIEKHDASWDSWFAQQRIQPARIAYEELSIEPQAVLATVLSALGLDSKIARTVEPRTAKLADSENLEWAARFRTAKNA